MPGEVVAWTGSFMSRRELLGIKLRWSYAPAEVKVLTSADGGNFEEASRWRRTARTEPSFEETIMFATPVSVKAVKVLMRGAKPWGYFGLSTVAAVAAPYSFMLVSGAAAIHEQCVVSTGRLCKAEQALGHVTFAHAEACHLQDQSQFDGKRQASHFRSGIFFQSCCGRHSGTGCSRQDWSAIWGGPLPTFTVDRRVCQSLGCSSQGSKLIETC